LKRRTRCTVRDHGDKLLAGGRQLVSLVDFVQVVKAVQNAWSLDSQSTGHL
jgi:hypothetical protein